MMCCMRKFAVVQDFDLIVIVVSDCEFVLSSLYVCAVERWQEQERDGTLGTRWQKDQCAAGRGIPERDGLGGCYIMKFYVML